jgi:hypothetical protein
MSKHRQRALRRWFKARYGRLPLKAMVNAPSEWRSLKRAWLRGTLPTGPLPKRRETKAAAYPVAGE